MSIFSPFDERQEESNRHLNIRTPKGRFTAYQVEKAVVGVEEIILVDVALCTGSKAHKISETSCSR